MSDRGRSCTGVVLAAGLGKRMQSDLPKVFHPIGGRPMVSHVVEALLASGVEEIALVIGHRGELLREYFAGGEITFVEQKEQRGTAHALLQTASLWKEKVGTLLVLNGDVPLIRASTIQKLRETHEREGAAATVLTTHMPHPAGYGRIVRTSSDEVERIVEERDATLEERRISEINTGAFCFQMELLFSILQKIQSSNAQNELYLTDAIALFRREHHVVAAHCVEDFHEVAGINTPAELAEAEKIFQDVITRAV